jgi:hypothetical protein
MVKTEVCWVGNHTNGDLSIFSSLSTVIVTLRLKLWGKLILGKNIQPFIGFLLFEDPHPVAIVIAIALF